LPRVGIDIADAMIARAQQKVEREQVKDRVELRAANAQNLPFDDALFDAVIAESVITFIPDKGRVRDACDSAGGLPL
jgi:ubiquinone/menaquinone biosynthesis C-methylase UbiE